MSLGGVIGFGVLAVVLMTACSLLSAALFQLAHPRLVGPVAEKNAAAWALVAPVVVVTSLLALIAWRDSGSMDHCVGHDHHAHFCLAHGAAWLHRPWAAAIAVAAAVTMTLRLAVIAWRRFGAQRAIAQVRAVSRELEGVRIAPSDRVFCFVAGWRRPEVYVSSRAWSSLSDNERTAVLAHERAHAGDGDLWMAAIIDVAASLAAPLTGSWLRGRWRDASERLCDLRAAESTSAETVAQALVRMCRAGSLLSIAHGFTPTADVLEQRIRSVLDGGPPGRRLGWPAWCVLGAVLVASFWFATHLHHALETLLG
jgi:Zn-dependent protease with chaperone function